MRSMTEFEQSLLDTEFDDTEVTEENEIDIENLDKNTVISREIFKYLFDIEDIVDRERKYFEILERARELGQKIKFEKLYIAEKKVNTKKEKELAKQEMMQNAIMRKHNRDTAITEFNHCEYPELLCGSWECTDEGVSTSGMFGTMMACYHPIMPVKRLVNIQSGREKMIVAFNKDGIWKEQTFDKSILLSASKIVNAMTDYGILISSENAKFLVRYFCEIEAMNVHTIQTQLSTSKMGWYKEDFIPYINENIIFDAQENFKSLYQSLHEKGNKAKYIEMIKKIRQSNRKEPTLSILTSLSSVLVKPCGVLPFIFHLYGIGGKGKTISLMLGSSVWGDPNEGGFMADAKSTKTAFEMRLNFLNNLPLICDDMSQVKESISGGRKGGDFSEFIYLVCSGRGNERSNVNLGLNTVTEWKNAILTNAEKPITSEISNGGELLRVIDYECEDGNIFENPKGVADFVRCNYGFLGKEFIRVIQKLGFEKVKQLHNYYIEKLQDMDVMKIKEGKQLIPIALLLTTDKILTDYIIKDGVYLDIDEAFDMIKTTEQMNDNERAYEYIMNEFNINRGKFVGTNELNERWGYIKDDFILFNPNIFNDISIRGNFNKKMFIKWAVKNGKSEINKNRTDKRVKSGAISGNFVFVKIEDIEEESELPF